MPPTDKAQTVLVSAIVLLLLSGLAAYLTIARLVENQKWVAHTEDVRAALSEVDLAVVRAGRARKGYVMTEDRSFLQQFESAVPEISRDLTQVREVTRDNPRQQALCSQLEDLVNRRVAMLRESIRLDMQSPHDDKSQSDLDLSSLSLVSEMDSVVQQMRKEEQRLLEIRRTASYRIFYLMVATLSGTFLLAIGLIAIHHRLLSSQLKAREHAETLARDSEQSLRRLTVQLLQLQDAERRRFSRELHDSLGQSLVGAKMNLEMFAARRKDDLLAEAIQLLDQSIAETRTISHLLHPPLLEEAGLSSAAKWYLEEFGRRSGIEINTSKLEDAGNLPKPVALGLFRILQEALINIHRHSGSTKAEVIIRSLPGRIVLQVRDYGKGIAPELLRRFQMQGTNSGVGLAGMQERTRELGGHLSIQPCYPGTLISTTIPLSDQMGETPATAAD